MLITLIVSMLLDYITGLMRSVLDKKLSGAVSFRGDLQKGADPDTGENRHTAGQKCGGNGQHAENRDHRILPE